MLHALQLLPPASELYSTARVAGQAFVPLAAAEAGQGWWCADGGAALAAARPHSRWAIVEPRQLLGPAGVAMEMPVDQLHFSRDHATGAALYVPARGDRWTTPTPPPGPMGR